MDGSAVFLLVCILVFVLLLVNYPDYNEKYTTSKDGYMVMTHLPSCHDPSGKQYVLGAVMCDRLHDRYPRMPKGFIPAKLTEEQMSSKRYSLKALLEPSAQKIRWNNQWRWNIGY